MQFSTGGMVEHFLKAKVEQVMYKSERFWDLLSYTYDKTAKGVEETRNKTIENIRNYLNDGDIVLDYACGTGLIANEIAGNSKKIFAIDISSKMIDAAKSKAADRKIENIDYIQSTIFEGQFKRESFDVILAINVVHLLEDIPKVMNRINELLKPGGFMISSTPCMGESANPFILKIISILSKIGIAPHLKYFEVSELEDSITQPNFQILKTENFYDFNQLNHFIVAKKI